VQRPIVDDLENWNHVHSITRIPNNPKTKNGGDYGIFAQLINQNGIQYLYEHYATADHHNEDQDYFFDYQVEHGLIQSHSHSH